MNSLGGREATEFTLEVPLQRLEHARDLDPPRLATAQSAGLDLLAAVETARVIEPGGRALIGTGIAIALPSGYEGQVRPRSGLALKHGVTVLNAPGTIDADYRGEVGVILINLGDAPFTVERGQRIAQLVIAPVTRVRLTAVPVLEDSLRGGGGFGSTGVDATGVDATGVGATGVGAKTARREETIDEGTERS